MRDKTRCPYCWGPGYVTIEGGGISPSRKKCLVCHGDGVVVAVLPAPAELDSAADDLVLSPREPAFTVHAPLRIDETPQPFEWPAHDDGSGSHGAPAGSMMTAADGMERDALEQAIAECEAAWWKWGVELWTRLVADGLPFVSYRATITDDWRKVEMTGDTPLLALRSAMAAARGRAP